MKHGFKPLSKFKQKHTYGGYSWMPIMVATLPMILETLTHAVASFKIIGSTKGSVKYRGYQSSWEEKVSKEKVISKQPDSKIQNHIYAY